MPETINTQIGAEYTTSKRGCKTIPKRGLRRRRGRKAV